jgi:hypothetical protein
VNAAPVSRLARFTEWLTRYGDAWEAADAEAAGELFTVGATMLPSPFADLLRGRRAIVGHLADQFGRWGRSSFAGQVLGVGDTYAVAHWRVSSDGAAMDGVLVAALDERGRCTSLRQWWHETFPAPTTAPGSASAAVH